VQLRVQIHRLPDEPMVGHVNGKVKRPIPGRYGGVAEFWALNLRKYVQKQKS